METRTFDGPARVISTNGSHSETFVRGERVKNIQRIDKRVMFEPVSTPCRRAVFLLHSQRPLATLAAQFSLTRGSRLGALA